MRRARLCFRRQEATDGSGRRHGDATSEIFVLLKERMRTYIRASFMLFVVGVVVVVAVLCSQQVRYKHARSRAAATSIGMDFSKPQVMTYDYAGDSIGYTNPSNGLVRVTEYNYCCSGQFSWKNWSCGDQRLLWWRQISRALRRPFLTVPLVNGTLDTKRQHFYQDLVDSRYHEFNRKKYMLSVYDPDPSMVLVNLETRDEVRLVSENQRGKQKNWVLFNHGSVLYCSYSLVTTHRVLRVDPDTGECTDAYSTSVQWPTNLRCTSNYTEVLPWSKFGNIRIMLAHMSLREPYFSMKEYYHAWVGVSAQPPFAVVGISQHFKLPCVDKNVCSIQFATSIQLLHNSIEVLYGEGDCYAVTTSIPLGRVLSSLEIPSVSSVCAEGSHYHPTHLAADPTTGCMRNEDM